MISKPRGQGVNQYFDIKSGPAAQFLSPAMHRALQEEAAKRVKYMSTEDVIGLHLATVTHVPMDVLNDQDAHTADALQNAQSTVSQLEQTVQQLQNQNQKQYNDFKKQKKRWWEKNNAPTITPSAPIEAPITVSKE